MTDPVIARALERLNAGIAWDAHGQAEDGECHVIAERLNSYLTTAKLAPRVEPLDIHNWLAENGVQDSTKFNKVQAIVEMIVGKDVVAALETREQLLTTLFRKIGYSV